MTSYWRAQSHVKREARGRRNAASENHFSITRLTGENSAGIKMLRKAERLDRSARLKPGNLTASATQLDPAVAPGQSAESR